MKESSLNIRNERQQPCLHKGNMYLERTKSIKGIGGVHLDFYKLILFYRVLSELSDVFNRLKKLKVFFENLN